jgi:hypothetical protein
MTGLTAGTLYYVRAYASNANGTAYGEERSFSTSLADQVPVLTTNPVTDITQTAATSGGNITFDGNSEVTARGVCWGTSPSPVYSPNNSTGDGAGIGSFISNMAPFNPNTTYYVRAYALNSTGYGYGNEVSFTTAAQQVQLPLVNTLAVNLSNLPCDSAKSGGQVVSDGGAAITARGVCWSQTSGPTVDLPSKTVNGTGIGIFTARFGGLASSSSYFLRAYATNSAGTGYGPEVEFTTCVPVKELMVSESNLVLYPNPVADKLYIQSTQNLDLSNMSIQTIEGKNVNLPITKDETGRLIVQTKDLPQGVYVIRLVVSGIHKTMKFFH